LPMALTAHLVSVKEARSAVVSIARREQCGNPQRDCGQPLCPLCSSDQADV
jgi:ABC-type ATPase with predicted acetyltransferase domain